MKSAEAKTWRIEGLDEDGEPETSLIEVLKTENGYTITWSIDDFGESVLEFAELDEIEEAVALAEMWSSLARAEYRRRERARVRELRQERKDALLAVASDLDGDDATAIKLLARLIGQGNSAQSVRVLKTIIR